MGVGEYGYVITNDGAVLGLGPYAPNDETLRAWASGKVNPDKIDTLIVSALADVFGVAIGDISTTAAENTEKMMTFRRARRHRCHPPGRARRVTR